MINDQEILYVIRHVITRDKITEEEEKGLLRFTRSWVQDLKNYNNIDITPDRIRRVLKDAVAMGEIERNNSFLANLKFFISKSTIEDENIIKQVCQKLVISQKELADILGVQPTVVSNWAKGQIPKTASIALALLLENKTLRDNMEIIKKAHEILHN